jgi:hypothetical protein
MTERQRLRQACARRRHLIRENSQLRAELHRVTIQLCELEAANFNLCVERDTADVLLGAAMSEARGEDGS